MALENLVGADKFIGALVPSNPTGGDDKREGDDHIRGIKNALKNSFPNVNAAVTATAAELSEVANKVNRAGDTMSGALMVKTVAVAETPQTPLHVTGYPGAPGQNFDALTLQNIDNALTGQAVSLVFKLAQYQNQAEVNKQGYIRYIGDDNASQSYFSFGTNYGAAPIERMSLGSLGMRIPYGGLNITANSQTFAVPLSTTDQRADAADSATWYITRGAATVGQVSTTATGTSYQTTSDYRLKEAVAPLLNSGAFIDALMPRGWVWKATGQHGAGFVAHELQAVSPSSVSGEKDGIDKDGKPVVQMVAYASPEIIANMVAELQSLRARVAALEALPVP